jgi:hypothetical protein
MKRKINFCLLFVAIFFFSCEKQVIKEVPDVLSSVNEQTPAVFVKNGILCFKNQNSVEALKQELSGKEYDELALWEESIGFSSIERASSEIMDAMMCRAESFVASGLTQDEVIKKFDSGEIQEVPDELQQKMDELKLDYKKDKNGMRYIDYSFFVPFDTRFLNEKFEVVIADTLYRYSSDFIDMFPEFSKGNFTNPIRVSRIFVKEDSSLKSLDYTTSAQLCFDDKANLTTNPKRRLTTKFVIERRIYQRQGCVDNCIYSYSTAYLKYQGYWRNWFGWVAGDYVLYYNGSFSVMINNNGNVSTSNIPIYQTNASSSPIQLYQTADIPNPGVYWVAFGNVDCFYMTIGGDFNCSFNIIPGHDNNGTLAGDGYSNYYYLYNNY